MLGTSHIPFGLSVCGVLFRVILPSKSSNGASSIGSAASGTTYKYPTTGSTTACSDSYFDACSAAHRRSEPIYYEV